MNAGAWLTIIVVGPPAVAIIAALGYAWYKNRY